MVRVPLTADQVAAGLRMAELFRATRGLRDAQEIARGAGISPETLRKIESGRMPSPSFGTVVRLADALGISLHVVADAYRRQPPDAPAMQA